MRIKASAAMAIMGIAALAAIPMGLITSSKNIISSLNFENYIIAIIILPIIKLERLQTALYFALVLRSFVYKKHRSSSDTKTNISITATAIMNSEELSKDLKLKYRFAGKLVSVVRAAQYK